ncbi:MAG TPA: hypothetical protein DHN33_10430 [Eubacteriaceae bacterium]|nr:hypothetical protein [Eubacteriaceae bacterium]
MRFWEGIKSIFSYLKLDLLQRVSSP